MLNIKFIPDSGFDFWYDHREKLQDVCIFPELRIDNLPERGHKILHQRITRLSDHFYFQQHEEYHDHWGDSDDQTIVQLPDSIPAGWTADQLIDWLIEFSDESLEMMQFTEEFSHQAMPSEIEVLDAETAFIYFTAAHPGYPRRCVMANACPLPGWSFDPLD